ncbi:membrane protein [Streptomyces sp. NRRL WC-3618]|nr:membrane protein [Streptomyces sp. NRRL WC-3618]
MTSVECAWSGLVGSEGEAAVAVNAKKIAVYVLVVFVAYVIITNPKGAAGYVEIAFEGISNAAGAIGDFMTWIADGAK